MPTDWTAVRAWLKADPSRTLKQAAEHFGVGYPYMRKKARGWKDWGSHGHNGGHNGKAPVLEVVTGGKPGPRKVGGKRPPGVREATHGPISARLLAPVDRAVLRQAARQFVQYLASPVAVADTKAAAAAARALDTILVRVPDLLNIEATLADPEVIPDTDLSTAEGREAYADALSKLPADVLRAALERKEAG